MVAPFQCVGHIALVLCLGPLLKVRAGSRLVVAVASRGPTGVRPNLGPRWFLERGGLRTQVIECLLSITCELFIYPHVL